MPSDWIILAMLALIVALADLSGVARRQMRDRRRTRPLKPKGAEDDGHD